MQTEQEAIAMAEFHMKNAAVHLNHAAESLSHNHQHSAKRLRSIIKEINDKADGLKKSYDH